MEPNQIQKKSNGALVGSVIIIIILIVGGIYLWRNSIKQNIVPGNPNVTSTSGNPSEATNLDANINSIDLDSLDNGI